MDKDLYFNQPNFNPGGLLDRFDNRDYQFEEVGGADAEVPFDWNKGFDIEKDLAVSLKIPNFKLTVKDQGFSFSCGGQAWATLAEVLEAEVTGSYEPRSAKYLYSQTCVPSGGSRGRDNADIYIHQGIARESVLPSYQNGKTPTEDFMQRSVDITDMIRLNARPVKASAYAQVGTEMESIAVAMRSQFGVVLGVDGSNNGTWISEFPKPPSVVQWRHWIYAGKAKKINGKKYIGILNSWGTTVGVGGWQWLGEDYFTKNVWSAWTHVFAPTLPQDFTHKFLKDMKYGQKNLEVAALQDALKISGEFDDKVPSTGYYGTITAKAVLAFQQRYSLITSPAESDGGKLAGPKTRLKLNSLFG